jgi:rhodanese-related sulfurtransferase
MKKMLLLCAVMALVLAVPAWADDIRVSREWLMERMDGQQVIILDVRQPYHWKDSQNKIKGALRREPGKVADWSGELAKDKVYVLYCA